MAIGKPDGEADPVDVLSALYDDELSLTDLPRSPWVPTREALADLDRRLALVTGGVWAGWIQRTIAMALRMLASEPGRDWPRVVATTRADLDRELDRLRPHLRSPSFAREVADDVLLAALVRAVMVIDDYGRRAYAGT